MPLEFDLLGHPIPRNRGEAGRNEKPPTAEIASKIRTLLVAGLTVARIAEEVGLSVPTMRKHYFANGKVNLRHARDMAVSEANAKILLQLQKAADAGNVAAMKEIRKVIAEARLADLPQRKAAKAAPLPVLGKKEARKRRAEEPKGGWAGRLPGIEDLH